MQNMYSVCLSNGYAVLLVFYNIRQNKKDMGSNHHAADVNLLTDICSHEGLHMQNSDLHPEKHTPKEKKNLIKLNKNRLPVTHYTATVILNSAKKNVW